MTYKKRTFNIKTKEETVERLTDDEAIALGLRKSDAEIEAEKDADCERCADEIAANDDRLSALGLSTVDLVMLAASGGLINKTRAEVRAIFRQRIVKHLRAKRGLPDKP